MSFVSTGRLFTIQLHRLVLGMDVIQLKETILNPFEDVIQQACENQAEAEIGEICVEEMGNWLQDLVCTLIQEGVNGNTVKPRE